MPMSYITVSRLQKEKAGSIITDGTEQTLLEFISLGRISGNVDLSNMQAGDTVIIRQYMKVKSDSSWKKYEDETYTDLQNNPLIYITPKETDFGIKVTLEQTTGVTREYEYNFVKEM